MERRIFVPVAQIFQELRKVLPHTAVDVVTISGSGEPTLAMNLGDIIACIKELTDQPVVVLTNGTLLNDWKVRDDLLLADQVAVKLDAVSENQLQRVNRPISEVDLTMLLSGLGQFRREYQGSFAIQTMLLAPWSAEAEADYLNWLYCLTPDEVQLNTPSRPRPLQRDLAARGNQDIAANAPNVQQLKCVSREILQAFADRIYAATGIPVRVPPVNVRVDA
jgi:wyosine [tRNA(Phe)-imidazoG37] synthetase (radical SAM superfamily)